MLQSKRQGSYRNDRYAAYANDKGLTQAYIKHCKLIRKDLKMTIEKENEKQLDSSSTRKPMANSKWTWKNGQVINSEIEKNFKKPDQSESLWAYEVTGNFMYCWWMCHLIESQWKEICWYIIKLYVHQTPKLVVSLFVCTIEIHNCQYCQL